MNYMIFNREPEHGEVGALNTAREITSPLHSLPSSN